MRLAFLLSLAFLASPLAHGRQLVLHGAAGADLVWELDVVRALRFAPGTAVKAPLDGPEVFQILGVWPNPANPQVRLAFHLPSAGLVDGGIFDLMGRRVAHWPARSLGAGPQEFIWHGRDEASRPVASGLYVWSLRHGGQVRSGRLMLLK